MSAIVRKPKHRVIFDCLQGEISSGKYRLDKKLPTEIQLAERFQASRPTVARALRELQSMGILRRRVGSGTYLADGSRTQTGLLGLLIPGLVNTEIFEPICAQIAKGAQQQHFALLWGDSSHQDLESRSQQAEDLCNNYIQRQVAGVFFAPLELTPLMEQVNQRIVNTLSAANIPVVLLDRDILEFPHRSNYDLVGIDNFAAGFALAEHLIGMGCRSIRFFAKPLSAATVEMRLSGVREAMFRANLPFQSGHVIRAMPDANAAVHAAAEGADAIVCANDYTAAVLMQTLSSLGVRVPDDVRIVGFDDVRYATLLGVPLTTIHQPCSAIGDAAVRAMLDRMNDPAMPGREIVLHSPLVIRQSCGAAAASKN